MACNGCNLGGSGKAVRSAEENHVKAVKKKSFRAREKAERKGWGHESKDSFDRLCHEIECCVHKKCH